MRLRRVVFWLGVSVAGVVVLVAGVLVLMVYHVPSAYRPAVLPGPRQEEGMRKLVNHISLFGTLAGRGRPFAWTITAQQANEYLGSMDAIAALADEPGAVSAALERAGLAAPAVAMHEGVLTVMVRSRRHGVVLSVDLAFDIDAAGDLAVRVVAARIGALPLSEETLAEHVGRARRRLGRLLEQARNDHKARLGPIRLHELTGLLGTLMEMIDGRRIRPEIVWPIRNHRVRIRRVEITEGRLTLHVVPVESRPAGGASGRRPGGEG